MDETGGATSKATETPIALPGGFISLPGAFPDARPELRHLLKLWYRPTIREVEDGSVVAGLEVSTDAMLVDFSGVTADSLDPKSIAADCDFVKGIVTKFPDQVRQMLQEMQRGTREGVEQAERIAAEIGFTESEAVRAGGGFFFLILPLVVVAIAEGCGGALKQKATSPAATTTPKPPPQPQ